jgi:DinB family protein
VRAPLGEQVALLERTPAALAGLLRGLPEGWVTVNEGPGTFSPADVLGHLIQGEAHDWVPRMERILEHGEALAFEPFQRFSFRERCAGLDMGELLDEFKQARALSLERLGGLNLREQDLSRTGRHPEFGPVTLGQLLHTWVAHDLSHLGQIARVMARRYTNEVGPWTAYLPILGRQAEQG